MSEFITVNTKLGRIKGICEDACHVFRGVPYARASVGQLRFCPPQPLEPFSGTYEAFAFPNRFIQREWDEGEFYCREFQYAAPDRTPVSEDALCLNIWTPAEPKEGGYPVAFWIHGGAFMHGFGHFRLR